MKKFYSRIFCLLSITGAATANAQNVWTQHNDQGRTGWYPYETTLNTNNVNQNTFGFYFSHTTDDKMVAQPLVVMNVNIPNKGFKNIVFATTLNNTIYAYDADVNADPYWQQNYTNKISAAPGTDCTNCRPARNSDIHPSLCGGSYGDFSGNMGIVGAPVIDTLAGTMYFVTKIVNLNDGILDNHSYVSNIKDEYNYSTTCFHQYLHAVDITTGNERANSPVEINPTINGTGDGQTTTNSGVIKFNPRSQFNRAGLVLSNGIVYIAFAAHCDNNPSHGWVIGYNASSLSLLHAYISTPNDGRGGIWMSGTAPAVDENGNLYFTTGNSLNENRTSQNYNTYNSTLASDAVNRGEGVVKLAPDLTLSSYFTPYNYIALNDADKDFGTQVMLIPNTGLAMTGCKDANLYVMNKADLGGYNAASNHIVQTVQVQSGATMHSTFAYFGGPTPFVYQFSENSPLKSYVVSSGGLGTATINTTIAGPSGGTGGFLSVSSNGTDPSTGILWAYQPINGCNANNNNCHGILHALNAGDITKELWNSDMVTADQINVFNKFSCPTIALGKVYIAANTNHLYAYGIKTNTSCVTNQALNKTVTALTNNNNAALVVDGSTGTSWSSQAHDVDSVYIDLGAGFDICRIAVNWGASGYGKDFDLKISNDGISWTVVKSVRGNSATYTEFNGSVTGRFVNMVGIARGTGNGYTISEFQVFGSPASACRAPGSLTATSVTPNSEHLSWDAISGSARYTVNYRPNLSESWITRTVNTNSLDISALTCGSIYYYTVQANCGAANSAVSSGSFTPGGCALSSCDILPVRYYNVDLGDIGIAGYTCKNGDTYTVAGSGSDIGGDADQFQFAYTNNDIADYDVSGHLIWQDQQSPTEKLGIMVRDSLTNTSRFAFISSVNGGYNIMYEYRDLAGGPVTSVALPGHYTLPYWMKINKTATHYTAYISPDNVNWQSVGTSVDLHFGTDPANIPNYGMAVTSTSNGLLSIGQVQNFTLLESNSSPLPVRLIQFTAEAVNKNQVLVNWATSMEHLVDHFEVQRSFNNKNFQSIDHVIAAGESETPKYYSDTDLKPGDGMNYYRLKEIDKDNHSYYSPVVSVRLNMPVEFEIYPNPALDYTNIISNRDPIVDLQLFDVTGKLIRQIHAGNLQSVRLNTSELANGIYFISVKTATATFRQKLFKQ